MTQRSPWILPVIIISQFAGGSLWFSGNAILNDLIREWGISIHALGYLTSAVQLGFISGTFLFAYFTISDRYSPRNIFFICSLSGSLANSFILLMTGELFPLILLRFMTGFFLAGIYPVGMKIAAGWYREGLGKALGFLVGALVLGTAFPHILKATELKMNWEIVLMTTSLISLSGGFAMLIMVPDGPYIKKGAPFNSKALLSLFTIRDLRSAAFGYFGHMWELYTLWAFIPLFLTGYIIIHPDREFNVPLWSFIIIAIGFFGCSVGGIISLKKGSAPVAFYQLALSGVCCLLSPMFFFLPVHLFLLVMIIWGITVVGDSPQYSAVIAKNAPEKLVGSALTLVNCIGFFLTVISIQFLDMMTLWIDTQYLFLLLLPGPLTGLYSMYHLVSRQNSNKE